MSKPRVPKKVAPYVDSLKPPPVPKPLGRPPELAGKVESLKRQLLESNNSEKLLNKVIAKALNDEDKDQMVALKLCIDRILPVSIFEKARNERGAIQINITGLTDVNITEQNNEEFVEDATIIEVKDEA